MTEPTFLSLSELLEIHHDQIERYGGQPGVRDVGLLQSAAAMPALGAGGQYLHGDLFEMAAAYLFHIVQNHPFVDGNKRTGVLAAIAFLEINDIEVDLNHEKLENLVLRVATGQAGKAEIAAFFREHVA